MGKVFRTLVSIEEAKRLLYQFVKPYPLGIEYVDLSEAYGRVLGEDVSSGIDVPPYDRSLRDGYAVRSIDVAGAREDEPVTLRVIDSIEAGSEKVVYLDEGEAAYVATGAPIPGGADSVVMEEYTVRRGDYVEIFKQSSPGDWIQYAGSDISSGDTVLRKGTLLGSREIGVLAAIGLRRVPVYVKPRVAIISTGDEIIDVGEPIETGKIYDVNAYTVGGRVWRDGGIPLYLGIARDDLDDLREKIELGLGEADIIVTSGSTSVGLRDNLYKAISTFNSVKFIFHGIEMIPGKPTLAALIDGKLFIGLPGFPVSCLMIYNMLFSNVIRGFAGLPPIEYSRVKAYSGKVIRGRLGVKFLHPVFLRWVGGKMYFYPVYASSGAIASLALSDGYIVIGERENYVDVGEERDVYLFEEYIKPSDLVIVSSHSIALDNLVSKFLTINPGINVKIVYSGSYGGIRAVEDGYNDFSGIHILDDESGEYNVPIIRKRGLKDIILYRGFMREFGIVVKRGNPLNIKGLEDMLRGDVRFINRSQGSGTRIFIDTWIHKYAEEKGIPIQEVLNMIKGYYTQAKTHSSVVYQVESGKADMGIASRTSILGHNVDFISLGWEYYDFLVNKSSLSQSQVLSMFIEYLGSSEAREFLKGLQGIQVPKNYMDILIET